MSEEEAKTTQVAAAETPAANGEGKANGKDRKPREPRDETPIEDLYDLSKPLPKVCCRKPSQACMEAA